MDFTNLQDGFGQMTQADLEALVKAMGTGTPGAAYGEGIYGDMSAIRPQSLETTLRMVTAKEEHLSIWRNIAKKDASSTVEEFNVLDSYGEDGDPFMMDGGRPQERNSHYIRQTGLIKFAGVTRGTSLGAQLVKTVGVGNAVEAEVRNGTMWLLQQINKNIYMGDSAKNPFAFDGILAQVLRHVKGKPFASQHIIDMRGKTISEAILEDGATIIADNWGGTLLQMYMTNQVHKDFSKLFIGPAGRQRIVDIGSNVRMGQPVRGYAANSANIDFMSDRFLKPEGPPKAVGQPESPAAPGTATAAVKEDPASRLEAGTYFYFVSSKGTAGESAPVATGSVAVTAGQKVEITIPRVVHGDPKLAAKTYKVYRGYYSDPERALFMTEFVDAGTGTTQVLVDNGDDIPGCEYAFLIDNDADDVLAFKKLADLMRIPLGLVDTTSKFMIVLAGMVQVYNPRRIVVFKNVGKLGENSNRDLYGPSYGAESYGTFKPVHA
ncbi:hypothetical protein G9G53_22650 [Paenibacillus sp. EKM206P]|uniref:hypothetical protein n=1 Tax=Paenibacillus sp. EKM206P TaxID=1683674 RepID=UPI0013ED1058|nr:hypothetical protein [Paenibacillus sp. EKM206P]KAF6569091.1 hypothetical protein G9G53_22650 [Paenibacillus sp. EKM206P]